MPDIRALLHESAASPSAPLDLDDLRGRSARRRTTRRATVLAIAAVAVLGVAGMSVALGDDPADRVELVGPTELGNLDSWSALAGLMPTSAWDGMVSFGRTGADPTTEVGFGVDTTGLREALGFDPSDFELWVNGGPLPMEVTIATGAFEPSAVDAAVRADPAWAPLLEVVTHRGRSFYSWGGDYSIAGEPSPGRPLGRGGRLLVSDELVVWTKGSDEMRAIIDRLSNGSGEAPPAQARLIEWAAADEAMSLTVLPEAALASGGTSAGLSAVAFGSGRPPRPGWVRTFGAVVVDGSEPLEAGALEASIADLVAGRPPDVDPLVQPGADELARRMQQLEAAGDLGLRFGVEDDGYWISFDLPESTGETGDQVDRPLSDFYAVLQALRR